MTALSAALERLGVGRQPRAVWSGSESSAGDGPVSVKRSPIDGRELCRIEEATPAQAAHVVGRAAEAFQAFREVPAPRRGELVRRIGEQLRAHRDDLSSLVSWEVGKTTQEAAGEVQEMIDMCEFAVGLGRQLHGLTIASERPRHRLTETWHPLGVVSVITAFNFPVAVWSWNAALSLVAGDPVVWKPSEKAPLSALACHALATRAVREVAGIPEAALSVVVGGASVGEALARDERIPLVSATGSVRMGRSVATAVAARLGRSLLELGGNNGMIVTPAADLALAERSIVFAAVGTTGQRCTTLRRLIVHESIADALLARLVAIYGSLRIGDPLDPRTLVGPLIDDAARQAFEAALAAARRQGGRVLTGGERVLQGVPAGGPYVHPAIVEIEPTAPIVQTETFAPILYVHRYRDLDDAIRIHNAVPQGLSSAIFTNDLREAERFCSASGSDCGIANVNTGTSGAEIGGAFGGEKQTGGGREAGSDAWKAYMRRVTSAVNHSGELPLAQGVRFDV